MAHQDEEIDYLGFGKIEVGWGKPTQLYPVPDQRQLGLSVPESIRRDFDEALRCFNEANAYAASAIMCRKVLEGICADHHGKGRTLSAKLKDLLGRGVLDPRLHEWTVALRIAGNDAAHEIKVPTSRDDASDMLDLVEAAAEHLYTFKIKFEAFKTRRIDRPDNS